MELLPWSEDDEPLLHALLGDPAMMEHLGGPESPEKIAERQQRYLASPPDEPQFRVVADGEAVGWVGWWRREWRGAEVCETGWSIVPAAQGRGLASAAARAIVARFRAGGPATRLHAFPDVGNAPSNAVCARAGFTLLGPVAFEYPPGHRMEVNDWCVDRSR